MAPLGKYKTDIQKKETGRKGRGNSQYCRCRKYKVEFRGLLTGEGILGFGVKKDSLLNKLRSSE